MEFTDILLSKIGRDFYDIDFESGDIKTTDGFDMALLMSVLGEKRASSSEVPAPERRRGWWGNEALDFDDYEFGSKLWLVSQERRTIQTLNNSVTYVRDSLQWMIDDDFLDNVLVSAQYSSISGNSVLEIQVDLIRSQNSVLSKGVKIWQNTGTITVD